VNFDLSWLSAEAIKIHALFLDLSYFLAILLILLTVICDYLNLSFFNFTPSAGEVLSRTFIALLLISLYPDIAGAMSSLTDSLVERLGSINNFDHVLSRMGEKLEKLSWSWTSLKDSAILAFSFLSFFLLYISVYIANAGTLFVWVLLYIFSPLLIILYILPATSSATKGLFRSLIEVCAWKIVWAVIGALLWSSALGNMNEEIHFLTVVSYNLILAASLLFTPIIVHSMISGGLSSFAASSLGLGVQAGSLSPGVVANTARTAITQKITNNSNHQNRKRNA
jgi:hypothetical protein